jgi:hypothetical protein
MKRIGTRIGSALAFVVALGVALGALTASAPGAEAAPRDISDIHWEATPSLLGATYRRVDLDVDRIEKAHEGMNTMPPTIAPLTAVRKVCDSRVVQISGTVVSLNLRRVWS